MPTYQVTNPSTGVTVSITGDSIPTEQELEEIFSQVSQPVPPQISDVPTAENLQADMQRQQPQKEFTLPEMAEGAAETLATLATGAAGGTLGALGGSIAGAVGELTGLIERGEGEQLMEDAASALTFEPRTEAGREFVSEIGGLLGNLPPFMGGVPTVASNVASIPTAGTLRAAAKAKGLTKRTIQNASSTRRALADEIAAGNRNVGNIAKSLDADGTLIPNPNLKRAIKLLGDNDSAYSLAINFELMNKATKLQANKILDAFESNKRSGDPVKIMENRPINAVGQSLAKRVETLNNIKKEASRDVGALINGNLGKKPVSISSARDSFINSLRDADIDIGLDEAGKIIANTERTLTNIGEVVSADKLNNILGRLQSGKLSAKEAHRIKRNLREMVSFDPSKPGATKVSSEIESAFKKLSTDLGDSISNIDNRYKVANTKMSESIDELKEADRLLGNQIMIGDELAASKFGALSKRIGTNLQSREQVINLMNILDKALGKRGIRPKDDIRRQVAAIADLEKIFKLETDQSPFGQQSRIMQGAMGATQGGQSASRELIDAAINKFRDMSKPEFDDKMKALRKLAEVK